VLHSSLLFSFSFTPQHQHQQPATATANLRMGYSTALYCTEHDCSKVNALFFFFFYFQMFHALPARTIYFHAHTPHNYIYYTVVVTKSSSQHCHALHSYLTLCATHSGRYTKRPK
jgi:hypothetical protein